MRGDVCGPLKKRQDVVDRGVKAYGFEEWGLECLLRFLTLAHSECADLGEKQ